ncbi:unnamed protein product, partial [Allacma fusca]
MLMLLNNIQYAFIVANGHVLGLAKRGSFVYLFNSHAVNSKGLTTSEGKATLHRMHEEDSSELLSYLLNKNYFPTLPTLNESSLIVGIYILTMTPEELTSDTSDDDFVQVLGKPSVQPNKRAADLLNCDGASGIYCMSLCIPSKPWNLLLIFSSEMMAQASSTDAGNYCQVVPRYGNVHIIIEDLKLGKFYGVGKNLCAGILTPHGNLKATPMKAQNLRLREIIVSTPSKTPQKSSTRNGTIGFQPTSKIVKRNIIDAFGTSCGNSTLNAKQVENFLSVLSPQSNAVILNIRSAASGHTDSHYREIRNRKQISNVKYKLSEKYKPEDDLALVEVEAITNPEFLYDKRRHNEKLYVVLRIPEMDEHSKEELGHAMIFAQKLRHIPNLNSEKVSFITDRDAIKKTIKSHFPMANHHYCFLHIKKNLEIWAAKYLNKEDQLQFIKDVRILLFADDEMAYNVLLASCINRENNLWSKETTKYFLTHLDTDIKLGCRNKMASIKPEHQKDTNDALGLQNIFEKVAKDADNRLTDMVDEIVPKNPQHMETFDAFASIAKMNFKNASKIVLRIQGTNVQLKDIKSFQASVPDEELKIMPEIGTRTVRLVTNSCVEAFFKTLLNGTKTYVMDCNSSIRLISNQRLNPISARALKSCVESGIDAILLPLSCTDRPSMVLLITLKDGANKLQVFHCGNESSVLAKEEILAIQKSFVKSIKSSLPDITSPLEISNFVLNQLKGTCKILSLKEEKTCQ